MCRYAYIVCMRAYKVCVRVSGGGGLFFISVSHFGCMA